VTVNLKQFEVIQADEDLRPEPVKIEEMHRLMYKHRLGYFQQLNTNMWMAGKHFKLAVVHIFKGIFMR